MPSSSSSSLHTSTRTLLTWALGIALLLSCWGISVNMNGMRDVLLDPSNAVDLSLVSQQNPLPAVPSRPDSSSSSVPLFSDRALLTIAVDNYKSCPEKCIFAHVSLPKWVRYRYMDFHDETDLLQKDDNSSHLLLVARTNIIKLGEYAVQRRKDHNTSVGLYHMADERFFWGEIQTAYHFFDYVIRHYYRQDFYNMTLRALGNNTCGDSPPLPSQNPKEPKWGVHWAHLDSHGMSAHMQRSAASIWPLSRRPVNCSFVGRGDVKRSLGERNDMKLALKAPELGCQIQMTAGFAGGDEAFQYYNYRLAESKIGLCPRGSAMETHRLAEVLRMGAVPALKDEEYLHATFVDVPAILGHNWSHVASKVRYYLLQAPPHQLELLARRAAQFSEDLYHCMVGDMDYILRNAFGLDTHKEAST